MTNNTILLLIALSIASLVAGLIALATGTLNWLAGTPVSESIRQGCAAAGRTLTLAILIIGLFVAVHGRG